jgi:hypothetical protein
MEIYKNKYLKYKNKYLKLLSGGSADLPPPPDLLSITISQPSDLPPLPELEFDSIKLTIENKLIDNSTIEDKLINNSIEIINTYGILNVNTILYHGTLYIDDNIFDISYSNKIWTSYNEQQSQYHMFDNKCSRYGINKKYQYPIVYKLTTLTKLNLWVLNIKYGPNKHYIYYNNKYIDINEYLNLIFKNVNKDLLDNNEKQLLETKININFTGESNKYILDFIILYNKIYNKNINGYICYNDQKEIALIKNYNFKDLFNIKISFFRSYSNNNETQQILYPNNDLNNIYDKFKKNIDRFINIISFYKITTPKHKSFDTGVVNIINTDIYNLHRLDQYKRLSNVLIYKINEIKEIIKQKNKSRNTLIESSVSTIVQPSVPHVPKVILSHSVSPTDTLIEPTNTLIEPTDTLIEPTEIINELSETNNIIIYSLNNIITNITEDIINIPEIHEYTNDIILIYNNFYTNKKKLNAIELTKRICSLLSSYIKFSSSVTYNDPLTPIKQNMMVIENPKIKIIYSNYIDYDPNKKFNDYIPLL